MCVYSNVLDHFQPLIPQPFEPAVPYTPGGPLPTTGSWPWTPAVPPSELRQILDDFKAALAAAKTVDRLVGHPDCEDPEKAKLVARVAELERLLPEADQGAKLTAALLGAANAISALPTERDRKHVARCVAVFFGVAKEAFDG